MSDFYTAYEVDCDDGTTGDIIYVVNEAQLPHIICGIENQWNGKTLNFVLDHIDGDASNSCRENVRLVCPNCDSQLDTFKSRNKKFFQECS